MSHSVFAHSSQIRLKRDGRAAVHPGSAPCGTGFLPFPAAPGGYSDTRYADDLTFSGECLSDEAFRESVEMIVADAGFTLNRRKSSVQKSTSRQKVTGIVVNRKPNVDRKYKRLLRAQLHAVEVLGPQKAACRNFRMEEAPPHLVSQYLLNLEGKKEFVEMVRKYS